MEGIAILIAGASAIASLVAGIWKKYEEHAISKSDNTYEIRIVGPGGNEISVATVSEKKARTVAEQLAGTASRAETRVSSVSN